MSSLLALGLMGKRIVSTVHASQRVQFRFPRSKKTRIRRKWAKREGNWRYEPRMYEQGDTLYVHPSIYAMLQEQFPLAAQPAFGEPIRIHMRPTKSP